MDETKVETETVKPAVPSSDHLPHPAHPAPFIAPPVAPLAPKPPAAAVKPETAEAHAARLAAEAAKIDADAEIEARRLNVIARYDMTGERAMVGNEVFCADPNASAALRNLAICLLATGGGEVAVGLSRTSGKNPGPARGEAYRDALSYLSAKHPVKAV